MVAINLCGGWMLLRTRIVGCDVDAGCWCGTSAAGATAGTGPGGVTGWSNFTEDRMRWRCWRTDR